MRWPPDKTKRPRGVQIPEGRKVDFGIATGPTQLKPSLSAEQGTSPATPLQFDQDAALERVEDLLACWRWRLSLEHRLRLAKLRFEFVGLDEEEQDKLAAEVAEFKQVSASLAEISKRSAAA
jgi:hypothetical protein